METASECASQPLANVFKRFLIQKMKANLCVPTEAYTYKELAEGHITSDQFMSVADFSAKMLRGWFAHTATLIHHRCEQKTSIPSKSGTHGSDVNVKSCLFSKMGARESSGPLLELCVSLHLEYSVGQQAATVYVAFKIVQDLLKCELLCSPT